MHKTTKAIVFLVVLACIALGIYAMKLAHEKSLVQTPMVPPTSEEPQGILAKVQFSYPPTLSQDTTSTLPWRTNTQLDGKLLASVPVPAEIQPKTNFRGASFTIGASDDPQAVDTCITPTNGERLKGTLTINTVPFTKITLTEAGAGNYYDTTSYRVLKDGACYAVEYTIHTTNINNYDPSMGITEFDTKSVVALLESMVQSVEFEE